MAPPAPLLDLDGTLTDPHAGITGSIRYALETLGVPVPPPGRLTACIGPPLSESFAEFLDVPTDSPRVRVAIEHYRVRYDQGGGWSENRLYPDIPAFLDAARAGGFRCFIATSKPTVLADRIATHFGLRERLEGVYGAELDGTRGHKPELLAHLLGSEGLDPRHTVMVGDRRHDVAGARANGVASVGVLWGYGTRRELVDAGAHALCDQPDGLLAAASSLLRAAAD